MDAAKARVKDIPGVDKFDVMTAAIYDQTGTEFVKIKHGVVPMPESMKPKAAEGK